MNAILIMKVLTVIGIILCVVMMIWKQGQLAKTPEGKANIEWGKKPRNLIITAIIGFVANFFDTLGIGSFAPSTSAFKFTGTVDDMLVPGTLNVGDTVPVCVEAFLFFEVFNVDPMTCVLMCAASVIGAFASASIVTKWDRTKVRWGFGICLVILAIIMFAKWASLGPFALTNATYSAEDIGKVIDGRIIDDVNGDIAAVGLTGVKLVIACVINFVLGAAMSLGIGLYAPCMALCLIMGLHTGMAFPIMMGSCAYLMAFGNGPKFIMEGRYDVMACWTQAIFGAIGVYFAAVFVKSLPLRTLTIIVVIVCFITGCLYIRDAMKGSKATA